ncbi:MAG: S8 family serine peptidase [Gaiellaceae bacterium]
MGKAAAALAVIATALLVTSAGSAATRDVGAPAGTVYTVAFNSSSLPANVDKLVADAGGTITVRLPQIGGLGVVSTSPTFASKMDGIASVAATQPSAKTSLKPIDDERQSRGHQGGKASGAGIDPQPEPDHFGSQQWDKMRMNVSLAGSYAINRGRPDVRVALADTGVDVTHPDIAQNLDFADSASFVDYEPSIQDFNGHGTWTASAVGAPINTVGISGVAPQISLVSLKVSDAAGNGELLAIDQALVYSGDQHFDVFSTSIVGWAELCRGGKARKQGCDDSDYILAQRAVDYARARGVVVIAALGNENRDLSDPNAVGSFLFGVPGGVAEIPGSLDGVVGVTSTGYFNEKAFYSNYGLGVADIAAPGGDSVFQPNATPYLGGGRLLGAWSSTSTLPADQQPLFMTQDCVGATCWPYAWQQGTSMATPNAAGVAALIVSRYGDFPARSGRTHMSPDLVERYLEGTAAPQSCPQPRKVTYGLDELYDSARCEGDTQYNGFFGHGIVDAVAALTSGADR